MKILSLIFSAISSFLFALVEWVGAPGLLAQVRRENEDLRARCARAEGRMQELEDRLLEKNNVRPFREPEALPAPVRQPMPMETLLKQDILAELSELKAMADADPDSFGLMYSEALETYRNLIN